MITKKRLKELIGQPATVYHLIAKNYEKINVNDIPRYKLDKWELYKEYYFETKEDVEFALRFKRIPRTEHLDLPTWEEFTKERDMEEFGFYSKYHKYTTLKVISDKYLAVEDNWERYYTGELTKENYINACELCLRLFRNEE